MFSETARMWSQADIDTFTRQEYKAWEHALHAAKNQISKLQLGKGIHA